MTVPYVALTWTSAAQAAAARASATLLASEVWTLRLRQPGLEVWTSGPRRLPVEARPDLEAVILGRLFPSPAAGPLPPPPPGPGPRGAGHRLLTTYWGEYLALLRAPGPGAWWVLREPSGALDALTWTRGGVGLVASDIDDLPPGLRPAPTGLNWDVITDLIRRPASVTVATPLEGLVTIVPGDLHPIGGPGSQAVALWRPSAWMAEPRPAAPADEAAIRQSVDTAIATLGESYARLLVEVSGGLDSAIVATTLSRQGLGCRIAAPYHLQDPRPEGDERAWADQVLQQIGGAPIIQLKTVTPLTAGDLERVSGGARPAFNALDPARSYGACAAVAAVGADAIFTGKGGDAVFFQHPSALVLSDYLQAHGRGRRFGRTAQTVARWLRRSVWSVAAEAVAALDRAPPSRKPSPLWGPRTRATPDGPAHPWLADVAGAPPAKRYQVEAILQTQLHRGVNPFSQVADAVHPLMSQPVLEAVLPIASWDLVRGGRERGLARTLFADRVPPAILARRSKGQLSTYFAQTLAASLPVLRPLLIEGCLAEAGVLDRGALEAALTADALIWSSDPSAILTAAAVESWVRRWQGQVPDSDAAPRRRR